MNIGIESIATYFPCKKYTMDDLKSNAGSTIDWADETGINELHVAEKHYATTDLAVMAAKEALDRADINPKKIDQVAFISEGISDYLYMDTAKTIIKKIGGRTDGLIYSYDLFRGSNGTIGLIKMVGNQIRGNPNITTSLLSTALLWEFNSLNRIMGRTFLGDGAGAIVLKDGLKHNQILSTYFASMSEYNLVTGFKYGGTRYSLTKEISQNNQFYFDILDEEHLKGVLDNIVRFSIMVGKNALEKIHMDMSCIDYVGISGFNKAYNDSILSEFVTNQKVINSLDSKGYLGSVGVIDVLEKFIHNPDIPVDSNMLLIAAGIDINVEAMIIQK